MSSHHDLCSHHFHRRHSRPTSSPRILTVYRSPVPDMKAGNGCQKLCRVRANTGHTPPCGRENKGHRVLWQLVTIHVRQYLHVYDARHPCSAPDFMIDTRVFLCRLCGSKVKLSTPLSDAHTTGRRERHSRKTPFRARAGLVFILRRLDAPSCRSPHPLTLLIPCEVSRS